MTEFSELFGDDELAELKQHAKVLPFSEWLTLLVPLLSFGFRVMKKLKNL